MAMWSLDWMQPSHFTGLLGLKFYGYSKSGSCSSQADLQTPQPWVLALPLLNEEKSPSNKTSPELTRVKELPEKNVKIANTNICLLFSKLRLEKYILKALNPSFLTGKL